MASLSLQSIGLWLFVLSSATSAQENDCPKTCLNVVQGSRFSQVEPIVSPGNVTSFYHYNKHGSQSFNGNVPLVPNHSHFIIHQDATTCGLDFVVVNDSAESSSGGQVHMKFHYFDVTNIAVKDGESPSSQYKYNPETSTSEVFWEWGRIESELNDHPTFETAGMAAEWQKQPFTGDCLEVEANFLKGIDYWRFAAGPVDYLGRPDIANYIFLDRDLSLKVCVGTCGETPADVENEPTRPPTGNHKKLVVFAGPHETGGNPVVDFLSAGAQTGGALDGWLWPKIEMNGSVLQHPFGYFVKNQDDEVVQNAVIEGILDAWMTSKHGVVIGAAEFDKIGADPDTGEYAVTALELLIKKLDIPNEDVKVVLTYRSPRVDHWGAIQKHFEAETYHDLVCSSKELAKLWEWIDTAMNPFRIANAYATMGYHVDVIDNEGLKHFELDMAHEVACNVMTHVECEGGFVKKLHGVRMSAPPKGSIPALSLADQRDLEELFLARDCFYKYFLESRSGFQLLHPWTAWKSCSYENNAFYQRASDTDFLMNAIQSQMSCAVSEVDVHDLVESKMLRRGSQLIVLAGPRQTKDIPMMKFFTKYASSATGSERSVSFAGWNWPTSDSILLHDKDPFQTFDLLVTHPKDRAAQGLLLNTIRHSWNELWHGVVIGSNNFERVGSNPATKFEPLTVLKMVKEELRIPAEDVTVVLNYRAPRVNHWKDLLELHFDESNYKDFLCSASEAEKKWEYLDTIMNPLKVASGYRQAGYRVVVIDESGVFDERKDVAHTLACNVMNGVACNGEWIDDIDEHAVASSPSSTLEDLSKENRQILEEYFNARDCFYMYDLKDDDKFEVLHQYTLWKSCQDPGDGAQEKYQSLIDTDFFLNLLRSQVGCGNGSVLDLPDEFLVDNKKSLVLGNAIIIASVTLLVLFLVVVASVFCYRRIKRAKRARMWNVNRSAGIFVDDPKVRNLQNSGSNEIIFQRYKDIKGGSHDDGEVPPPPKSIPPLWAFAARFGRSNDSSGSSDDGQSFESIEFMDEEDHASVRKKSKTKLSSMI